MNWKHIEAMMRIGTFKRASLDDGTVLISNTSIMLPWRGEFEIADDEQFRPLRKLWINCAEKLGEPVEPGAVLFDLSNYRRQMGPEQIDEAYFRCFNSDRAKWILGPKTGHPPHAHCLLVLVDGVLAGGVMPMRQIGSIEAVPADVSDAEVFQPFVEETEWYLANVESLTAEIDKVESDIDTAESRICDLRERAESLRHLRSLLTPESDPLLVERSQTDAQPKAD